MKIAALILLTFLNSSTAQELGSCTIGGCATSNGAQVAPVTNPSPISLSACQNNFSHFINGYGNQLCGFYGRGAYTIRCKASWANQPLPMAEASRTCQ